jgi:hypothetical protein
VDCDPAEQPQAGDVFCLRTDSIGLPEPVCKLAIT